ncbi:sigma-E factor regulatory protein RseB domain-containing protein [Desulfitobacterium sp. PCE1]|uniref:LolA family protein n=1 Tax=Desulfitobacterium sp. PCE1 TaxID=146907 RepID=UPI00037CF3E9|nr:sigma-E factor regulatory protein RseB domain-containing protein [Desulfitobacterium sp. PCE1]
MSSDHPKDHPSPEELLDHYIDALNGNSSPEDYDITEEDKELQSLAKRVKAFDSEPSQEFMASLWQKLEPMASDSKSISKSNYRTLRFIPWAGLVASILVFLILFSPWSGSNQTIVMAMEESVKQLQNYHGVLEKVSTNEAGERQVLTRTEIWSDGEKYATKTQNGLFTVNNGEIRWSTNPAAKEISLLPIYLDPHDFDLQKEAAKALRYPHQIIGEDTITGHAATHIEIQPPGGLPYSLWIDQETHLPIQLQTAMQKSLQTTYTYVSLETNTTLTDDIFAYNPPQDYKVIDKNPDKAVASLEEALKVSGMTSAQLSETPQRIFASANRVVLDFGDTIVVQAKATTPFVPDLLAILGKAEGGPLEILPNSLRWQQDGREILVQGERVEELAKQLSTNLNFTPQVGATPPQDMIPVEVDMEVVKNSQQQVDAGSSPWQLDPTQVAFTFVALKISPEGITGEPPLNTNALQLTDNDGKKAVIQVSDSPVKTVYLERLIRQDETGIWTVTGYVPR